MAIVMALAVDYVFAVEYCFVVDLGSARVAYRRSSGIRSVLFFRAIIIISSLKGCKGTYGKSRVEIWRITREFVEALSQRGNPL
jgi:hypothetical protein